MDDLERKQGGDKRRVVWIVVAVIVLAVAVFVVPRWLVQQDPLALLAERLGVDEDTLILNLPPRPSRYPGTVLLPRLENAPVVFVESNDAQLKRGSEYDLGSKHSTQGSIKGSLDSSVLGEVANGLEHVEFQIEVPRGQVVEMLVPDLLARIRGSSIASRDSGADVVVRSFEGRIRYSLRRRSDYSLELWRSFTEELENADSDDELVEVRVATGSSADSEVTIEVTEPVVFAYLVSPASELMTVASLDDATLVPREQMRSDPRAAVEGLLDIGVTELPDATRSLREIGPGAEPALEDVMRSSGQTRRIEGARLFMKLPPITSLTSPESPRRTDLRAILDAASRGPSGVVFLTDALGNDDSAARLLAAENLGELATAAAGAADALRTGLDDADAAVRVASAGALLRVRPDAAITATTVRLATEHPNPAVRSKAVETLGSRISPVEARPLLEEGLRDPDPGVRLEAIEAIRRQGSDLRGLAPALERVDRTDPQIDRAVLEALRGVRGGGG